MKITEVYFRSSEKKPGQQWFEVYNDASDAINLKKAVVSRYDGKKTPFRAWVTTLPDEDFFLLPGQYAVIAQRADLGKNLCSEHGVIVSSEPGISFKAQGVQTLCILTQDQLDDCVQVADSRPTPKNRSRDFSAKFEQDSKCELKPGLFASPGLPADFCEKNIDSAWTQCPEAVAETASVRQTARQAGGCQMVLGSSGLALELVALALVLLLFIFPPLKKGGRGDFSRFHP